MYLPLGLFAFSVYVYSFYNLGNTCYRMDGEGKYHFHPLSLFTEGFIGPLRTIYYCFQYNGFRSGMKCVKSLSKLHNPWFVLSLYLFIMTAYQKLINVNKVD